MKTINTLIAVLLLAQPAAAGNLNFNTAPSPIVTPPAVTSRHAELTRSLTQEENAMLDAQDRREKFIGKILAETKAATACREWATAMPPRSDETANADERVLACVKGFLNE